MSNIWTKDAPISRVDLLACRNTLMYMNSETHVDGENGLVAVSIAFFDVTTNRTLLDKVTGLNDVALVLASSDGPPGPSSWRRN